MAKHVSRQMSEQFDKWLAINDTGWVKTHVERFGDVRPQYKEYEGVLATVLKLASSSLAPLSIVEARAKSVPSFAEKILRKRSLYMDMNDPLPPDPLVRMTDLCGGRVIAQTSEHVRAVCQFIEKAFDIDWPNSEDVSGRLAPTEFGYRSVHYIVMINAKKLRSSGIRMVDLKNALGLADVRQVTKKLRAIKGLKAEIQVRTMLEHVPAHIGHDRLYKTDIKIPDRIRRQSATLSAILEEVDHDFERLVNSVEEFKSNFGAYHTQEEVESEIERFLIVLKCDSRNIDLAVKIAQLALSIGKHELALKILDRFSKKNHQGLQRVRGIALTEMHWEHPHSAGYREGRRALKSACEHEERDAETLCDYAESMMSEDDSKTRELYYEAVTVDSTEPVTLSRYIEFEVRHGNATIVKLASPMIRNAMARCRKQIEGRVNLPQAWASLFVFHLLMREPYDALKAVAQVIRLCQPSRKGKQRSRNSMAEVRRPCAAGRTLMRMRETFRHLRSIEESLEGYEWCERAVQIGLAVRVDDPDARDVLNERSSWRGDSKGSYLEGVSRVVTFSGGCEPSVQRKVDVFRPILLEACGEGEFTLLCGGTTSGISGLAGDVAERSKGRIQAFGYMPRRGPWTVQQDTNIRRFARLFKSNGNDFTPFEPLQGWTDLVAFGVDPQNVRLLSYAGKAISNTECAMALALGARVGVVDDESLPKDRQFKDAEWQDHPHLSRLPMDPMTIRAFLLMEELPCEKRQYEPAAKLAHEEYVKTAIPSEPALAPWDELDEDLKISNYHQVIYAERILESFGLGIRKITAKKTRPMELETVLGKRKVRRLAQMEHGRWNVERLFRGWRYAEKKDVAKKRSPYLVSWNKLPRKIQNNDVRAVKSMPRKLNEVGMEIYVKKPPGAKR